MTQSSLERLAEELGILFDDTKEILLVDDDTALAGVLAGYLKENGLDVRMYPTAEAALEAFSGLDPGVALVDMHMPGINGLELTRRLKAQRPDLVIIVITGDVRTETLIEAMRAGVHDYLVKPFESLPLVAERVAHALEMHNERRRAVQLAGFLHEANVGLVSAQADIEAARTEIEMFNRVLEEKVRARTRQQQAAMDQLEAFKSAIGVLRADLNELAETVTTLSRQMTGEGQTPHVDADLMGLLVDIRRVTQRIAALG